MVFIKLVGFLKVGQISCNWASHPLLYWNWRKPFYREMRQF